MVFLLMCAPTLCHIMLHTVFANISNKDFATRCRIPQLENTNWSFEQIHHLSAPLDKTSRNCTYYQYNYSRIAEMNYDEALKFEATIERPNLIYCTKYVHQSSNIYSVYEEFSLVCKRVTLKEILIISPVYGKILGSIFLVPLADLLGRKSLIKIGAKLFIAGGFVMSLAPTVQTLIVGRMLAGMAYATMILPIEAIVVEISNVQLRPFRFIAMNMGISIGFITTPLFATKIWNWRLLQWIVCSTLLILPLTAWYVPESPRWYLSKGNKYKAWATLRTIKDPVDQSELLFLYQNEKRNYMEEMQQHFQEFKPFVAFNLWFLTILFFLAGAVYFKNFVGRFEMNFHTSRPIYFMLSGIAEIVAYLFCVSLLLMCGRKVTMALSFLCGGIAYVAASWLEMGSVTSLFCLLVVEIATAVLYATSLLYLTENVPTSHRCTATGLVSGFGAGLSTVIMFHTYYFITDHTLFVMLGCMCFVGMVMLLFAYESKNNELWDTVEETTRIHFN